MDRIRLLRMELPSATSISNIGSVKGNTKISFVKRMILGFVILAVLGLLYVPAYHSAQGPFVGLGETPSPTELLSGSHLVATVAQLPGWTYNTSRDVKNYIHPDNITSILSPIAICSPPPYLIVIICSSVGNYKARMAIRNTWANKSNLNLLYNSTVKVAFLLGQSDNETLNNLVLEESLQFNDILQEKFSDTYNNLTLKSIMMLKWVTSNCEEAKFIMKTDDDMFVNIVLLMKTLQARTQSKDILLGSLICSARPISNPTNKWYMPKYMYPEKVYPNYLSGTGYVMSIDAAFKLYQAALSTPLLHLEDVYITGLCAKHAKINPTNHPGFSYAPRKLEPCILKNSITTHKINASTMYTIWNKLNNTNISCNNKQIHADKQAVSLSRSGRNVGYYMVKRRVVSNKCV
ncbi:beta-1,3-galactosyltransferase 1-like isoform X1 [Polistes fuscatus]|uniref:beta-1,3-galactosyltransferase 1-like isoform X1 n=1 Tax=Polistes fuscatus TaxID=30207 RepID=UPI001CA8C690|nr:beta-1,3-galactosyltransferase 1-like isoform X1 [Polistes fuscatus]XP_043506031.1 beta-1,3-galactosyltransferase 1-like isoform X1 [Polistes fuscatus]